MFLTPNNEDLIKKWEEIKFHLYQFVKIEIGMETMLQLSGQLILLLNSNSETTTNHGLDKIFREETDKTFLLVFLYFSIIWSLKSCVWSNVYAMSAKREHFPMLSKLFACLYTLFACICRVVSTIIFFTPSLGLFSCLRHLQAEQTRWHPHLEKYFVENGTIQFGNSPPILWKEIDRWQNVSGVLEPPHHSLYGQFKLKEYFIGFWILWIFQLVAIYFAKFKFSEAFKKLDLFKKVIHVLENSFVPTTCDEWDSEKGNVKDHQNHMMQNLYENLLIIFINFIFNVTYLVPIFILGEFLFTKCTALITNLPIYLKMTCILKVKVVLLCLYQTVFLFYFQLTMYKKGTIFYGIL